MENQREYFSIETLIIGSLFLTIFLLFFFILFFRLYIKRIKESENEKRRSQLNYQKSLLTNSIDVQEKERKRIAADIHDDLIGQLRHIQLMNNDLSVSTKIKRCITTARSISYDLSPPLIQNTSLTELMDSFLFPLQSISINFYKNIREKEKKLNDNEKLNIFRIFQEVITNIEKHAQTNKIVIYFKKTKKQIILIIADHGIGLNFKNRTRGLGLKNIELRASHLKACYKYTPNKPKGTKFIFKYDY